ncbi:MAG: histidine phosphatase family protein [Flavobacteriaceae bacterium]|nr:histidine phosphatase family protein [Flavobacteriaceae bacterium]MDG2313911.1 histidine phosphatase family protein [Flavobacteriaceae bacterium]
MKKLVLVRHAKSSWEGNYSDRERPIKSRGIRDAYLTANALHEKAFSWDAIYTSPAKRAYETALIFVEVLKCDPDALTIEEALYDFDGRALKEFVCSLPDHHNSVLVFGHNHALTALANHWGGFVTDNVPTSGIVILDFDVSLWSTIESANAQCLFPKQFR